jgi:tRNA A-37 threonylcarbamoyl transferase component Bud32
MDARPDAAEDVEIGAAYVGTVLDGRYLIQEIIGHGGMGTVFRAEQTLMQKTVAIKLLHADLAARKQVVGRFTREARAISRLSSPHTIRVFDFGRWQDLFFLVMELLQGDTLDVVLAEGPMPYERVARIVGQMCDSLGEAHEAGVVHRDLKPENIFLTRQDDGTDFVKILDFGLAKLKNSEDLYDVHSRAELFGTPYYMSPEQIRAGEVDGRSDIYSVGALMFRMLTGHYVHGGEQATFEILKAHLMNRTPRMADVAPAGVVIPSGMERIVAKCLAKTPEERFQTMAELAQALQDARAVEWQAAEPEAAPDEEPELSGPPIEALARRTTLTRIAAFVLVILVLAGTAALVLSAHVEPPAGREVEPNDDARHPGLLALDGSAVGFLGKRRSNALADQDCFQLPKLSAGQTWRVQVTGLPNMDLLLTLNDKDGDARLTVDHRGRGQGELLRWPDPRLPVTSVCVTEAVAQNGTASESLSDQYMLQVTTEPRPSDREQEPNDLAPGETLPVGALRVGSLDGPKDREVFRLEGAVDGRLMWFSLELSENPPAGTQMVLLDQAGRSVASRTMRAGERSTTLGFVPDGDQIPDRLILQRQTPRDVPASPDAVDYRVEFSHRDVVEFPEVEPNDTPELANPLALGAWQSGSAHDGEDWLRLDGGDPSLARIRLEARAPGSGAYQLTVRDVGQQVDVRTLTVQPDKPQDLVLAGSGDGVLLRIATQGKGEAKWQVRVRYLRGVVTAK